MRAILFDSILIVSFGSPWHTRPAYLAYYSNAILDWHVRLTYSTGTLSRHIRRAYSTGIFTYYANRMVKTIPIEWGEH